MTQTEQREKRDKFKELAEDYIKSGMKKVDVKKALKRFKYSNSQMDLLMKEFKVKK